MSMASRTNSGTPASNDRLWDSVVGNDLSFRLARANALSLAGVHAALAEYDLRVRSYSVLAIAAEGSRPSQRELSEFLRLDPSQIVALVDDLESRGLVRREPDPQDRRANVLVATDGGRELFRAARAASRRAEQEFLAPLGALGAPLDAALRMLAGAPDAD
ncbi:MarR family winged helix-turn-helix transcriptional regulator [Microbacterium terregens]|uniref:MarR family winged helix-turn-helix transcriptional regulator n=1 Tax=Microbacterium terregens TaxID=69363 RepID=A0ABV5SVH7_9MICO